MTVPRCRGFFPALDGESARPIFGSGGTEHEEREAALVTTSHDDIIAYCLPHFSALFHEFVNPFQRAAVQNENPCFLKVHFVLNFLPRHAAHVAQRDDRFLPLIGEGFDVVHDLCGFCVKLGHFKGEAIFGIRCPTHVVRHAIVSGGAAARFVRIQPHSAGIRALIMLADFVEQCIAALDEPAIAGEHIARRVRFTLVRVAIALIVVLDEDFVRRRGHVPRLSARIADSAAVVLDILT